MFVNIAKQSLLNRKGTVLLTVLALTISIFVLLAVEHIRHQAKESFSRTVSGVDLIVGPRTGPLNLLLGSVFRIGETGQAISWHSYEALAKHPMVEWAAPIALGDSHRGHRVIATTSSYYQNFKYGNKQSLKLQSGRLPSADFDLVLGADIADKYHYHVGEKIVLSHGTGVTSFTHHDATPFTIVGILEKTGTPVDQALHIGFVGLALMHGEGHSHDHGNNEHHSQETHDSHNDHDSQNDQGSHDSHENEHKHAEESLHAHDDDEHSHDKHNHENEHNHGKHSHENDHSHEHGEAGGHNHNDHESHAVSQSDNKSDDVSQEHESLEKLNKDETKVSAIFVGLKARYASLIMQKWANDFTEEPISAILPGVALTQLWRIVGSVEVVLQVIAALVLLTTLIGMSTMLLASMKERTREIAIMRTLGARPIFVFGLIQLEVFLITLVSLLVATAALYVALLASQAALASQLGLFIEVAIFNVNTLKIWGAVLVGSMLVGLIPALKAYRSSLQTSLQIKV